MNIPEMLDAAKEKLGLSSDYALAKRLGIHSGRIAEMRQGKSSPDHYVWCRLGIILNRDPMALIAEVEVVREKDESKREFWKDFLSRVPLVLIVAGLALSFTAFSPDVHAAKNGMKRGNRISVSLMHNATLCEVIDLTIKTIVSWFHRISNLRQTLRVTGT